MGTRADFYVGKNEQAEWIGSIAWGGYEYDKDKNHPIAKAKTEKEYREAVKNELLSRDDATFPEMGWPWPWDNSGTTDYAYSFEDGKFSCKGWKSFPDMSKVRNTTLGRRSGLVIFRGK